MEKKFLKNCPICNNQQSYTTEKNFKLSIKENWVCNKCSITHQKKNYTDEVINNIVKLYFEGVSYSKISILLKIKRDNVKNILKEKNIWIENRDKLKKEFNDVEINDIITKYNEGFSLEKIGKIYNVSKTPIKNIIKNEGLLREGRSDGVKIDLSNEQIEKINNLYLNEYKNSSDIGQELNLSKSFIDKYLKLSNIRRTKSEGVSVGLVRRYRDISYGEFLKIENNFKKYKNDVMKITNQQPINELANYEKRGNSGVNGAFHLDHKFSILEGFKNNISPNIIGNIKNLEFIPWEENIKKRTKNSITINELLN
jgi:transposase-like protein/predicted transcriptional regulator